MKKILLTMAAGLLTAGSVIAQTDPALYLIGANVDGQSWALETNQMKYDAGQGTYTWEGSILDSGFKINDGTWNAEYNIGTLTGEKLTLGQPYQAGISGDSGNIEFNGVNSVKNPKVVLNFAELTVTVTGEAVTSTEPSGPVDLYLIGSNVDGQSWTLGTNKMTYDSATSLYTWTGSVLGSGFKINDGSWSHSDYNIGAGEGQVVLGEPYKVTASGNSSDITFAYNTEVTNPKVVFDYNNLTLVVTENEASSDITLTSNIKDLKVGDQLEATAIITALDTRGFILTDNAGSILYYNASVNINEYSIGNVVKVSGEVSSFNTGLQLSAEANVELIGNVSYTYPEAVSYTPEMVDEACTRTENYLPIYVSIEGQINISGNYINVLIDGASAQGSVYYATDEIKSQLENGKYYCLSGYFTGVSGSSTKYFNIVVSSVKEVSAPTPWSAYFTNPEGWEQVYVWAWNETTGENFTGGVWPGVAATYIDASSLWYVEGVGVPEFIIFNNNQGAQTDNLPFKDGAIYDMNGIVTPSYEITSNIKNLALGNILEAVAVVTAQDTRGFVLTDNAGSILYYNTGVDLSLYPVGTVIKIDGEIDSYNYGFQLTKDANITILGSTTQLPAQSAKVYTAEMVDAACATTDNFQATLVTIEGKLSISGNYYNIIIDGATAQGSIYYPTEAIQALIEDGKYYAYTGYFMAVSSAGKYFNMVVSSVEEIEGPAEPEPAQTWDAYFTNPEGWEQVYVWAWNETTGENFTGGTWPGVAATYVEADKLWYIQGEGNPEYIIFNNNDKGAQTGNLKFVNGATYDMKGTIFTLTSNIKDLAVGDNLEATAIVTALDTRGFILTDNAGSILYYNTAVNLENYPIGTVVTVNGKVSAYNFGLQLDNSASIEVVGATNVTYPEAEAYTEEMIAAAFDTTENMLATYVSMKGKLSINGNYYNVIFDGIEQQGSLYYPTDDLKAKLVDGETYTFYGYFTSLSAGKYFYMVVTEAVSASFPETLYMLGDIKGYGWDPETGLSLTKLADGIFQIADVEMEEKTATFFAFTSEIGSWDIVNANRVSPAESNTEFVLDEENEFVIGHDTSWQIVGGVYTFTVDFNTMTVTATGTPYDLEIDDTIYLVGSMTDWAFLPEYALTADEDGTLYTGSFQIQAPQDGILTFKFANKGWDGEYNIGVAEGTDEFNVYRDVDTVITLVNSGDSNDIRVCNWATGPLNIVLDIENLVVSLIGPQQNSGISSIDSENGEEVIFNLQGVRVNRNQISKGLYIINGKKVMVK